MAPASPDHPLEEELKPEAPRIGRAGLGTFDGVFRPTVLTIIGVIMYLREGWVVGQAGLLGAILIILLTFVITGTAALSLASIATNIRVGSGGVFHIISQALGLEPGGSIGVPMFLGQALSSALYLYGFSEAWGFIFPQHPPVLVAYCAFLVVVGATLASTRLAFRLQGIVMIVILLSFASILLGITEIRGPRTYHTPELWGLFEGGGFWVLFAIFFPAGTGVQVGASMSGALADPRTSIPRGTLAAVGTALGVYLLMAVWYSLVAPPDVLRTNYLVVVEQAAWGGLVLVGILASTFTAALSSMVAAPRVLQAMAEQGVVPGGRFLARLTRDGEPRMAALLTGLLVAIALMLGNLDRVAILITMFFLLTYLAIHVVMVIEQSLGMISFRPLFRIPRWVPLVGIGACLLALFVISPSFALIALAVMFAIYVYLSNRKLKTPWETVRSSIFVSLADWAARQIAQMPEEANERSWKPDLLVPVESRRQLDGTYQFLRLVAAPKGSLRIIGVRRPRGTAERFRRPTSSLADRDLFRPAASELPAEVEPVEAPESADELDLAAAVSSFRRLNLFVTSTVIEAPTLVKGVEMSASVLRGSYFQPNILFGLAHLYDQERLQGLAKVAEENEMGLAFLYLHPESGFGYERSVNVWVSDQSPEWKLGLRLANLDLTILLAYQISRNWSARIRLSTAVRDPNELSNAEAYLKRLITDARLGPDTEYRTGHGRFMEMIGSAGRADLHVLGLAKEVDLSFLKAVVRLTGSSCLFVRDSGKESALA